MISVNDFRTGTTIEVDGDIWQVMEFQHVKPGKGAAFVRSRLRNLRSGSIQEKTFRAGERVSRAHIENRKMQYLFSGGTTHTFMDTETYEQMELQTEQIKEELNYITENMEVHIRTYGNETLGIEVPKSVRLKVVDTEPGVRGDTASGGGTKAAVLETGLTIQVPLFINEGEVLVIDTINGEYVSRA